jgi:serine protease AprX
MLYRTEIGPTESYVEEDYLAAALERAVDSGAQVINVSLGYRYDFNSEGQIPYSSMNGRTRPASIAALGAARRGVLVVVAIGNEGASRPDSGNGAATATITSPADADSILTVGIQLNGNRCSYSSTGPTFDGRLKPELTSVGLGGGCVVYLANPDREVDIHTQSGTSFAAPVVAGVAALLRQLHPDSVASSQKIRQALMITSKRSGTPDNLMGNGLMRAAQAHCALLHDSLVQTSCALPSVAVKGVLVWRGGNLNTMTWPTPLDLRGARLWDLQGRAFPVSGRINEDGAVELTSGRRLAPGTFILRIPRAPDPLPP